MDDVTHKDGLAEIRTMIEREIEGIRIYFNRWWFVLSLAIKGNLNSNRFTFSFYICEESEIKNFGK